MTGLDAAQMRAVGMIPQAQVLVDEAFRARIGDHGARQAQLAVARDAQEIELPAGSADQDVRARDIAAPREIETDEGDHAGSRGDIACGNRSLYIAGQGGRCTAVLRLRHTRIGEQRVDRGQQHRSASRHEALGNEFPARRRPRMILSDEAARAAQALGYLTHNRIMNLFDSLTSPLNRSLRRRCRAPRRRPRCDRTDPRRIGCRGELPAQSLPTDRSSSPEPASPPSWLAARRQAGRCRPRARPAGR